MPDAWDFDHADQRPPVPSPRAVVSVAFSTDALQTVAEAAQRSGVPVSTYIRMAALSAAQGRRVTIYSATGSRGVTPFVVCDTTG